MIALENLSIRFGQRQVLNGLNLVLEEKKTTVILGPSGIGKSVMLKIILGLLKPQEGRVQIDGEDLLKAAPIRAKELRRPIGMLLQQGGLFDSLSVYDNIAFPLRYHRSCSEAEIRKRVERYSSLVEIDHALDVFPQDLSGGMRRKAALARALIQEPRYLLYDEPTTGLDPASSALVEIAIRRLGTELAMTSLVVTHDIDLVRFVADEVALLKDGRILYKEPKEQAFKPGSPIQIEFLDQREQIHREHGYS